MWPLGTSSEPGLGSSALSSSGSDPDKWLHCEQAMMVTPLGERLPAVPTPGDDTPPSALALPPASGPCPQPRRGGRRGAPLRSPAGPPSSAGNRNTLLSLGRWRVSWGLLTGRARGGSSEASDRARRSRPAAWGRTRGRRTRLVLVSRLLPALPFLRLRFLNCKGAEGPPTPAPVETRTDEVTEKDLVQAKLRTDVSGTPETEGSWGWVLSSAERALLGAGSPCCHVTRASQRLPCETDEGGIPGRGQGGECQDPTRGGPRLRNGRGERKEGGDEGARR